MENANNSRVLGVVVGALLGVALSSQLAWGQDVSDEIEASDVDAEPLTQRAAPTHQGLDEVIVTAQKRAQSIQEVPLSITAISGEAIKMSDIQDMNELSRHTPNLKVEAAPAQTNVYVRGLGSDTNEGFEQSVGVFIDDIYYSRSAYLNSALLDINRVEVLRGPQGSLFGKNTISGAISIYTGIPDFEFTTDIEAQMGEWDSKMVSAVVNAPIIDDTLAVRVAGYYQDRGTFMTNTFHNTDDGEIENRTLRAKVRFDPSEDVRMVLTYLYNESVTPQGLRTQYTTVPDEFMTLFQAFDPEAEDDRSDGQSSKDTISTAGLNTNDLILNVGFDLWNHDFTWVSGGSLLDRAIFVDADFGPTQGIILAGEQDYKQWSSELKVVSPEGVLEYVAGLYYFGSILHNYQRLDLIPIDDIFADAVTLIGAGALAPVEDQILGLMPDIELVPERVETFYRQENHSYAAYGQATWHATETLRLIVGARYAVDFKDLEMQADLTSLNGVVPGSPVFQAVLSAEEFDTVEDQIARDFSPKVSALWSVTEWANLYATYAQGFKAGGFNANATNDDDIEFGPEVAVTYEGGLKTEFWDNRARVNVGLFRTEFEDLQVTVFTGVNTVVRNAAGAVSQGLELDGTVLFDFGLLASFSYAWLDAKYKDYSEGSCPSTGPSNEDENGHCDLSDRQIAKAPKYQASLTLNQMIPLGNLPFGMIVGLDILHHGGVFLQHDLDPLDYQEAYTLLNGRVGVGAEDLSWSFLVSMRNITDEVVLYGSADVPVYTGAHYGVVNDARHAFVTFRASF